jgi:hypothetical protein
MVQIPSQPLMAEQSLDPANLGPNWQPETPDWDRLGEEWLSDEPELETDFHRDQVDLLLHLMKWHWRDRTLVLLKNAGTTSISFRLTAWVMAPEPCSTPLDNLCPKAGQSQGNRSSRRLKQGPIDSS